MSEIITVVCLAEFAFENDMILALLPLALNHGSSSENSADDTMGLFSEWTNRQRNDAVLIS